MCDACAYTYAHNARMPRAARLALDRMHPLDHNDGAQVITWSYRGNARGYRSATAALDAYARTEGGFARLLTMAGPPWLLILAGPIASRAACYYELGRRCPAAKAAP